LPSFACDVEVEGDDFWNYGYSQTNEVGFNVTCVGEYHTPACWTWMWGVPDRANYQVVVCRDPARVTDDELVRIRTIVAEILECPVTPYPRNDDPV
jgi:hypothetical protein